VCWRLDSSASGNLLVKNLWATEAAEVFNSFWLPVSRRVYYIRRNVFVGILAAERMDVCYSSEKIVS